jgi:hypothetical protein
MTRSSLGVKLELKGRLVFFESAGLREHIRLRGVPAIW